MGWIIAFVLAIIVGSYFLWTSADKADYQRCKDEYGSSYTLGHSPANSSIKWCQAPDGTVKAL